MIRLTLDTAGVLKAPIGASRYAVVLPANGAILAYCSTSEEAERLVAFFRTMSDILGGNS